MPAVRPLVLLAVAAVLALPAAGCGRARPSDEPAAEENAGEEDLGAFEDVGLSGRVRADGSSTLAPFVTEAAEEFRADAPEVRVTVGIAGTGGGFERFCRGETDLSTASRAIEKDEKAACEKRRIDYLELHIANDGISVAVNPENDWARCLTVEHLKAIWAPGSDVDSWSDVDDEFPDEKLALFGPGTDSGTFDYFTEAIVGEEGKSRSDYQASEDDHVVVRGIESDKGALGYVGLSYVEGNERVRSVEIDGGKGCVAPSTRTVQNGSYEPLSRPLFVYVNRDRLEERPEVDAFLTFMLDNQKRIARRSRFVPLTTAQLDRTRTVLEGAAIEAGDE